MRTDKDYEPSVAGSPIAAAFSWLGGGHRGEPVERHERSSHTIAGVVVVLSAVLACVVATLAVGESTQWPTLAVLPFTLVFGVLVAAVIRATASGPQHGRPGILGRGAVAVAIGVAVGELAALVLFAGPIDRHLEQQALRTVDATPAVAQRSADLAQARAARAEIDDTVQRARQRRDEALVVARCEYNPTPACPQTRITGVPGSGPETRTANDLLADAQLELTSALADSDRQLPGLTAEIAASERALTQARETAVMNADRGLGSRWMAMHDFSLANTGALLLRMLTVGFFALLSLLPLIIRLWRGETTYDLDAAARAERHRAEVSADTAIAVRRAEVRAAAETLWAEQQLASARLAVEAQTEIDRAQYRRQIGPTPEGEISVTAQRDAVPGPEDMYLPIAAEAEAASRALTALPEGAQHDQVDQVDESSSLPARVEAADLAQRSAPLIPSIPEVTRAAARWIRPLVPPLVGRAIDTTVHPLRAARQVYEEVEHITFSLKRTHKITVDTEHSSAAPQRSTAAPEGSADRPNLGRLDADRLDTDRFSADGLNAGKTSRELRYRGGLAELEHSDDPRQLPPVG